MRGHLVALVSVGFIAAVGCGGSSGTTTSGSSGATTGGGSTTGGTTTGGSGTTTGSNSGTTGTTGSTSLGPGAACTANSQCQSDICGITGIGRCCTAACSTSDATCGGTSCDSSGLCVYPGSGGSCGADSCTGELLTKQACDGHGNCVSNTTLCPNAYACHDAMTCNTSCNVTADCGTNYYCDTGTHQCAPQQSVGACTSNATCLSGVCGLNGTGNCCTAACSTTDLTCGASACDFTTGACVYPVGTPCGSGGGETCTGSTLTSNSCDTTGACSLQPSPCPNHFACDSGGTSCLTSCTAITDCASGYYCNAGACLAQRATGPCTSNETCTSGICGISGTGHFCCTVACLTSDPICGASDCDATGACRYANKATSCGDAGTCTAGTETAATLCDGMGSCPPPAVTDCAPYTCGPNACQTSCTDNTACSSGNFCDSAGMTCCSGLVSGGTISVDGKTGVDNPCCGLGFNGSCKTLTRVMSLINAAQAQNVTIKATVNGGGGDWAPAGETYPINLGWGAELNAPGVFFLENATPTGTGEIFDVVANAGDTLNYASIVGSATSLVGVGMNAANNAQTAQTTAITVETGQSLYIANASVNGSFTNKTNAAAILVQFGGTLWLGTDQGGTVTGTVNIGNNLGQQATDSWVGIACGTDAISQGCTIKDATLTGASSVVIQGQEFVDIDAEDYASVSLTSKPVLGVPPTVPGFANCPFKPKTEGSGGGGDQGAAFLVSGPANVTFDNGTVQCIGGFGFYLQGSLNSSGTPTVSIDNALIQNVDYGIYSQAGAVTVTNSTLAFNYVGVFQNTASTGSNGSIDLSGGGNTVVCSSNQENGAGAFTDGMDVYNNSANKLAADNVAWDTASPDYFSCDNQFTTCTCLFSSCSATAPFDDMDAVEDSTALGGITTTGNTVSGLALDAGCF